ncbi:acyl-CoA dehydrogenase family protein [Streptomyces axinellae]|uniref:Acyl-CoA dehydrogenase family protein n=1 Tax=Streptomyces axinellae TaxID=552788 RepID=A0ABN3QGH5_9ACTN
MRSEPRFSRIVQEDIFQPRLRYELGLDEAMALAVRRARLLHRRGLVANSMWCGGPEADRFAEFVRDLGWIGAYDFALLSVIVDHQIAGNALLSHGSPAQVAAHREEIDRFDTVYAFAATELGRGSDLRRLGTEAHYSHTDRTLTLRTPDDAATKCWIGNSLFSAEVAMTLARLIVDGVDEGHHWIRVPLREKEGALPYDGIRIQRADPKGGIVANQTGMIRFEDYRIPADALMSSWARISPEGRYQSDIGPHERFSRCMETFIQERIFPVAAAAQAVRRAAAIAVRYSTSRTAYRRPLIGHAHYQERLTPIVARALALREAMELLIQDASADYGTVEGRSRLYGRTSGFKAAATWQANTALGQLRELCGGHGFHAFNEIVSMRNDFEINTTFAGDNTILCYESVRVTAREPRSAPPGPPAESALCPAERTGVLLAALAHGLLDEWRDTGRYALCVPHVQAATAAAVLARWRPSDAHGVEAQLRDLYGIDSVLQLVGPALAHGLLDQAAVAGLMRERADLCGRLGADPELLLAALDVPEPLLDVPIAHPDYEARTLDLAADTYAWGSLPAHDSTPGISPGSAVVR